MTTAQDHCQAAFHLLKVTYPSLKDHHLLLAVLDHLCQATHAAMESLLAYERQLQLIPTYGATFAEQFQLFRQRTAPRNNISPDTLFFLQELHTLQEAHKNAPMEFPRRGSYVICDREYRLKTLSGKVLQAYLEKTAAFLQQSQEIQRHYSKSE